MAYQRFAPQNDVPWRTYDVMDQNNVWVGRDGGPFEITRRAFRPIAVRRFTWAMPQRTNVALTSDQRQVIDSFLVRARQFALDPFLVHDPKDPKQLGINIGTGDGIQTVFPFTTLRNSEYFRQFPFDDATTIVYDNGGAIATGNRTIDCDGRKVTLVAAPLAGHAVTIDYDFYRLVMFTSEVMAWSHDASMYASAAPDFEEIIRDAP